ncbi:MAG: ABC transporter permease subunit/CPBP intramembrane protease [Candidatus Obscuribacterales bacterium]
MNSSEIFTVFRKELKETVRDWRTLCVGILVPLILYPISLVVASKIMVERRAKNDAGVTRVIVTGPGATWVREQFARDRQIRLLDEASDSTEMLKSGKADVVVNVPCDITAPYIKASARPEITVQVDELKDSNGAYLRIFSLLREMRLQISEKRMTDAGIETPWLKRLHFNSVNVEDPSRRTGAWLSLTLPLTLVLLILTATLFPAIDLITGERERGTLPVLLVSAIRRDSIVYGKLLVVFSIGVVTVVLLLTSLIFMLSTSLSKIEDGSGAFVLSLSPINIFMTVPLAFPLVLLFGSMGVWISAYARNFQQGQGYSIPYLMTAMFLAAVSLFPVKHLPAAIYIVPVSNVCVCMTEILRGEINWAAVLVTFVSSSCYGLYVSRIAIDLLSKEETLFKIQVSPARRKDYDRIVAILYACTFIAMFYIGQIAQVLDKVYGMILTQLFVICLPSFALVAWLRLPFKEVFSFKKPRWRDLLGAPLMAPGTVLLTEVLVNLQNSVLPMSETFAKALTDMMTPRDQPMWMILFAMAVMPGICEEVLFRGAIFGLLRRRFNTVGCCVLVGVLFGFFHLSGYRLLPTTLLGIILTLMVFRGGSIFPCMLFHASHNALAIIATSVPESRWNTPATLAAAVVSAIVGTYLVFGPSVRNKTEMAVKS